MLNSHRSNRGFAILAFMVLGMLVFIATIFIFFIFFKFHITAKTIDEYNINRYQNLPMAFFPLVFMDWLQDTHCDPGSTERVLNIQYGSCIIPSGSSEGLCDNSPRQCPIPCKDDYKCNLNIPIVIGISKMTSPGITPKDVFGHVAPSYTEDPEGFKRGIDITEWLPEECYEFNIGTLEGISWSDSDLSGCETRLGQFKFRLRYPVPLVPRKYAKVTAMEFVIYKNKTATVTGWSGPRRG